MKSSLIAVAKIKCETSVTSLASCETQGLRTGLSYWTGMARRQSPDPPQHRPRLGLRLSGRRGEFDSGCIVRTTVGTRWMAGKCHSLSVPCKVGLRKKSLPTEKSRPRSLPPLAIRGVSFVEGYSQKGAGPRLNR